MKFSDLKKEFRQLTVDIDGESLNIAYYVNAYTPELEADMLDAEHKPATALAQAMTVMLKSWDLEDDDGKPYPLAFSALSKLPLNFMLKIFEAIGRDMRPNLKPASDSSGISSQAG